MIKGGLLKLSLDAGWERWHANKKIFNLSFLILKVRYPAISYIILIG